MDKTLYPKARISFYISLLAILIMLLNLFSTLKWLMFTNLFISFLLAIWAIATGIINLRFIYRNEEKYRGDSMCWIAISLGVIALLSNHLLYLQFWQIFSLLLLHIGVFVY
ncbi:MAG: hypothetical protein HC831_06370 [Chloroflexia bacterium]|nr:hypothetical protein [Chloroflexia bacterium]